MVSAIFLVLITIICKYWLPLPDVVMLTVLVPPVGVYIVAGCGADLFINICLTLLGYVLRTSFLVLQIWNTTYLLLNTILIANLQIPSWPHPRLLPRVCLL